MTCFAARLKQLRNQRGLTQTEVAAAIGVTRSVVSLYENEMRQPSPEIIVALARSTALQRTTCYVEIAVPLWTFRD